MEFFELANIPVVYTLYLSKKSGVLSSFLNFECGQSQQVYFYDVYIYLGEQQLDDPDNESYASESEENDDSDDDDDDSDAVKTNEQPKKKLTFPHWCVYIA